MFLQDCGITEQLRLAETSGSTWSNPCFKQGHPELGAQSHVHVASEDLQAENSTVSLGNLCQCTIPVHQCTDIQMEHIMPTASCPDTRNHRKDPGSALIAPSFQVFIDDEIPPSLLSFRLVLFCRAAFQMCGLQHLPVLGLFLPRYRISHFSSLNFMSFLSISPSLLTVKVCKDLVQR